MALMAELLRMGGLCRQEECTRRAERATGIDGAGLNPTERIFGLETDKRKRARQVCENMAYACRA
jgi:hypothetical protein